MNIFFDTYERCHDELKQCIDFENYCRKKIKTMPKGYLETKRINNNYYYYQVIGDKRIYLNKSKSRLKKMLASKKYLLHCQRYIKMQKKSIEAYIAKYDASIALPSFFLSKHPEIARIIMGDSFLGTKELQDWTNLPYDQKDLEERSETVRCAAGHFVRSKSECIIADALFAQGIPYRYEEPLLINGIKFLPDFTVYNIRSGKKFIWEHLGMADKEEYIQKTIVKITYYIENGYFPGVNLILTGSDNSSSFDSRMVMKTIEGYLL